MGVKADALFAVQAELAPDVLAVGLDRFHRQCSGDSAISLDVMPGLNELGRRGSSMWVSLSSSGIRRLPLPGASRANWSLATVR